ncbi:cation-translocating P-type ATPase [Mycobacterium sp.]|uniref:cation-translocating P-type ATPase n=1 Tax=Mycobacterium sp. TaxID=1785 RepID=UPI002C4F0B0D|nr:cation-translocating P-type ATPase [Mycobacterium sp.]HTY35088.1 cation-translocating P-type ATPase [Mycobacterium sp.]
MTEVRADIAVTGLTAQEAARRLAADGPNELPTERPRNLWQQTWDVIREPMIVLLLAAGLVNFLLAKPLDAIMLMGGVVVVIVISVYQEHRTERALAALRNLSSPRALVTRDGEQVRIAGREVVRGDVILLAEGDRVPADAVVVDCANFSVDESALTGESVSVRKVAADAAGLSSAMGRPGGDATPWIFSGTLVVKGHGVALVNETGAHTELGKIGAALRTIKPERTRLQREIDRLVRVFAVFGVAAAVIVVVVYGLTRGHWLFGVDAGIGTAMALLPEEFPVVLSVFLALGAWRLSKKHVLTRRPAVIETLGSTTVLCVDKTGTLTLNRMTVRQLIVDGQTHTLDERPLPEDFHTIAEFAVLASPVDPFDPMDKAFKELGEKYLSGTEHLHGDWQLVREYPLSEKLLALSHVWRSGDGDRYIIAAKGAPEAIADLCHFNAGRLAVMTAQVENATDSGLRVLAVAGARFNADDQLPAQQHDFDFHYLGLAGLVDPVRPGVADAVAVCGGAGIRTIMITGDYPGTALEVAREIGLDHEAGCITGQELHTLSDNEVAGRISSVSVFARMVPEQKLRLVRGLQAIREVVGMTGDGVNDAPALRAAEVGIAMGAHGTDVARESAALVITDDDFTSIVGGVRQGRGVFDNLRKALSYVVAVHVPIAGMSLLPVFVAGWPLVLLPVQIAFLELIIDPACSVAFEGEEIDPEIMQWPPRRRNEPMFTRRVLTVAVMQGLWVFAAVVGVYLWMVLCGRPDDVVRSVTFAALVVGNLALILVNRSWRLPVWRIFRERRNPTVMWIVGGAALILVLVLTIPWLRHAFHFGAITLTEWLVAVAAGLVGVAWFEIYKVVTARRQPHAHSRRSVERRSPHSTKR